MNLRSVLFGLVLIGLLVCARRADAYPWMIRHGFTDCQSCHADPSGGGLLTRFGRLIGDSTLRTLYGKKDTGAKELGGFLFGVPLPEPVLLGGDFRYMGYSQTTATPGTPSQSTSDRFLMQADLEGQMKVGRFRANGSIGYADVGGLPEAITTSPDHNLISRVHWVGVELGSHDELLVRAGRINIPFGIRTTNHLLWVRSATFTRINDDQEDGVAVAYNVAHWRAEVLGIAGNFQISPDAYRERGYAGYVEYAPSSTLAVGASSEITHANTDVTLGTEAIRQNHGLFARYSPSWPIVLLGEGDFVFTSQPPTTVLGAINAPGFAGMLQADFEPIQGVHLMVTEEMLSQRSDVAFPSVGGWGTLWWFFAPHADLRLDGNVQSIPAASVGRTTVTTVVLQGHVYL